MKKSIIFYLFLLNLSSLLIASELTLHVKKSPAQVDIVTPKKIVCFNKLPRAIQFIIADYAGLNEPQNNSVFSSLQSYIQKDDFYGVAVLINCGALVNGTTPFNKVTPLYGAIERLKSSYESPHNSRKISLKIIHFLLLRGADINQQSPHEFYKTALHQAVNNHHTQTSLRILISAQADLNVENEFKLTPLDVARKIAMNDSIIPRYRKFHYESCKILEEAGAQSSVEFIPMPSDEAMQKQYNSSFSFNRLNGPIF